MHAGIKNLKFSATMRIEVCEPIGTPPFFAALSLAFLEPLNPEFQLQPILFPGTVEEDVMKPLIKRVLNDAVFSVRRFSHMRPEWGRCATRCVALRMYAAPEFRVSVSEHGSPAVSVGRLIRAMCAVASGT